MVKFADFSRPLCVFPVLFKADLIFKDLFKIVMYIQVLFKTVSTLIKGLIRPPLEPNTESFF